MPALELPTLADEHVELRGWRLEDALALAPAFEDEAIRRFTTVPRDFTLAAGQEWIVRQHARAETGSAAVLAMLPRRHHEPVGMVGLFGLAESQPAASFGYWVLRDWRGRGLATAATALLARWGFDTLGLCEIHIDREQGNDASARVAQRLGATVTGSRTIVHDGADVELIRHTIVAPARG